MWPDVGGNSRIEMTWNATRRNGRGASTLEKSCHTSMALLRAKGAGRFNQASALGVECLLPPSYVAIMGQNSPVTNSWGVPDAREPV
jgi:hypothetical protein